MEEKKLNKIKVIIPFYNPGDFLDNCINSVLTQDYDNYEVLFINDCSTDGSEKKVPACYFKMKSDGTPELDENNEPIIESKSPILEVTKCKNVVLWSASQRNSALPNIHQGVMNFCTDPEDIAVLLDGDDALLGKGVLSYINDFYNEHDCWVSWGESRWSNGMKSCSSAYSELEYKNVRKAPFRVSHIRSFKSGIYRQILNQDSNLNCFKEKKDGTFYFKAYDVAIFFPILDMTPFEKAKYCNKALYWYNRENPLNEDKNDGQYDQTRIHMEIAEKPSFKQIKDYITGELV